jgi:hypothetical protein
MALTPSMATKSPRAVLLDMGRLLLLTAMVLWSIKTISTCTVD